ncbi:DNA repair protein RecO [candidate division KSB1 bacterium]|nr:DNA repair protein RecO [candidate division KSB1 bacterium]
MPIEKTKAIVLKSQKLGETSKIITLYSDDFGKIKVVAKGARSLKSRFMGSLEDINYISVVFYYKENRDLHLINQADIIEPFKQIKSDLVKYALASLACEMMIRSQIEGHPNKSLFKLLLNYLYELCTVSEQSEIYFFWFQLNFLINNGFKPKIDKCLHCSKSYSLDETYYFSYARGGYVCQECDAEDITKLEISGRSLKFLSELDDLNYIKSLSEPVPSNIVRETSLVLYRLMQYHVSGLERLSSLEFLRNVWSY